MSEMSNIEIYQTLLTNLQRGRFEKLMDKEVRVRSDYMSQRQFIQKIIKEGYTTPRVREDEKKKEYSISNEQSGRSFTVTKTEHDFVMFLINKGYTNDIDSYFKAEEAYYKHIKEVELQKQMEEAELSRLAREARDRENAEARERHKKARQDAYEEGHRRYNKSLYELIGQQAKVGVFAEKIQHMKDNSQAYMALEGKSEEEIEQMAITEIVDIYKTIMGYRFTEGADKSIRFLKHHLEATRGSELVLKQVTEFFIEHKEDDHPNTTHAKVKAFVRCEEYKPAKDATANLETFTKFIKTRNMEKHSKETAKGKKYVEGAFTFFLEKGKGNAPYSATEEVTGLGIGSYNTVKEFKDKMVSLVEEGKMETMLTRSIRKGIFVIEGTGETVQLLTEASSTPYTVPVKVTAFIDKATCYIDYKNIRITLYQPQGMDYYKVDTIVWR